MLTHLLLVAASQSSGLCWTCLRQWVSGAKEGELTLGANVTLGEEKLTQEKDTGHHCGHFNGNLGSMCSNSPKSQKKPCRFSKEGRK